MLPEFLLPETVTRADGAGPVVALEESGGTVLLTLGITRTLEQESLEVSVWGSPDREQWQQLAAFPHKSYCGTYSLSVDLSRRPVVRFLRAQWKMGRWNRAGTTPLFGFYLFAEEIQVRRHAGAA